MIRGDRIWCAREYAWLRWLTLLTALQATLLTGMLALYLFSAAMPEQQSFRGGELSVPPPVQSVALWALAEAWGSMGGLAALIGLVCLPFFLRALRARPQGATGLHWLAWSCLSLCTLGLVLVVATVTTPIVIGSARYAQFITGPFFQEAGMWMWIPLGVASELAPAFGALSLLVIRPRPLQAPAARWALIGAWAVVACGAINCAMLILQVSLISLNSTSLSGSWQAVCTEALVLANAVALSFLALGLRRASRSLAPDNAALPARRNPGAWAWMCAFLCVLLVTVVWWIPLGVPSQEVVWFEPYDLRRHETTSQFFMRMCLVLLIVFAWLVPWSFRPRSPAWKPILGAGAVAVLVTAVRFFVLA